MATEPGVDSPYAEAPAAIVGGKPTTPRKRTDHVFIGRARIQLIAGMIPVNLVNAIRVVGFDYGMSAQEVAERVVDGHLVLWETDLDLGLGSSPPKQMVAASP